MSGICGVVDMVGVVVVYDGCMWGYMVGGGQSSGVCWWVVVGVCVVFLIFCCCVCGVGVDDLCLLGGGFGCELEVFPWCGVEYLVVGGVCGIVVVVSSALCGWLFVVWGGCKCRLL